MKCPNFTDESNVRGVTVLYWEAGARCVPCCKICKLETCQGVPADQSSLIAD